ncbi:MAG: cysteine desulfurase-like protein [Fimbriimonas sp.]
MPATRRDVRAWFPALQTDFAFLENAGGSQVPACVADAVRDYMLTSYVQLGAGYPYANEADRVVQAAHAFIETFMGAGDAGRVVLGPSTTALTHILANAYAETLKPGDEIVVAVSNHEANAGPWVDLERRGATIRWWPIDGELLHLTVEGLRPLLNERTRLVALPHVSNLLGQVVDLRPVVEAAHEVGARVVADGVAYAPHRAMDVAAWGVDWYVYSAYKVYGPHMAALYGRHEAFAEIEGPNHFFIPRDSIPAKFELGGVDHEGCAGLLALRPYLRFLAGREADDRATVTEAFEAMETLERPLTDLLVDGLRKRADVKLLLPETADNVATVSFLHRTRSSAEVARHLIARGIGLRNGHMYAYRLCEALGIDPADGVVRISLLHYNTPEEVEAALAALDALGA